MCDKALSIVLGADVSASHARVAECFNGPDQAVREPLDIRPGHVAVVGAFTTDREGGPEVLRVEGERGRLGRR